MSTVLTENPLARRVPLAGPLAERVFPPHQPSPTAQPKLPWPTELKVFDSAGAIDPADRQRATSITVVAIETISGLRPLSQLDHCFATSLIFLMSHLRRTHQATGLRVQSMRMQSPAPDVIEVSVHLRQDKHSCAAALRLVRQRNNWICTRFEIALRPDAIMRASIGEVVS